MPELSQSNSHIEQQTRESLKWFTIVPFLIHLIRFINSIILARILLPSDFGVIGILTVIFYYCDSFTNVGFGNAIVQRKHIQEQHYTCFFTFNLFISTILFLCAQFFSKNIANFFQVAEIEQAFSVYAWLFILSSLSAIPLVKLRRSLHFKSIAIIEVIKICIAIPISLSMAIYGFGFWAIITATISSQLVAVALLLVHTKFVPKLNSNIQILKQLLHFSLWDFIGGQFKFFSENIDKLIIGKILGVTALGFYDKATGVARMPNEQVSMRISNVSFSALSRIQHQPKRLENLFIKIFNFNLIIMVPILTGLIWVSESFTMAALGIKWQPIISCMQILAGAYVFSSLTNPVVSINLAMGNVKQQASIRVLFSIILLAALIHFAPLGIEICALIIFLFNLCILFSSIWLLSLKINGIVAHICADILPCLLPTIAMLVILFLAETVVESWLYWQQFFAYTVVGVTVYSLVIFSAPITQFAGIKQNITSLLKTLLTAK